MKQLFSLLSIAVHLMGEARLSPLGSLELAAAGQGPS
jgi:hypothetical protein